MRNSIPTVVLLTLALVAPALAQTKTSTDKGSKPDADQNTPITLTGCVSGKPLISGDYTFIDATSGSKYRLNGKGMKKYAGQQVEIVSRSDKGVAVKGGLYPSPNVAAQAGALDPAQEAIARQPGGPTRGTEGVELPEFRVARVRPVTGACQ